MGFYSQVYKFCYLDVNWFSLKIPYCPFYQPLGICSQWSRGSKSAVRLSYFETLSFTLSGNRFHILSFNSLKTNSIIFEDEKFIFLHKWSPIEKMQPRYHIAKLSFNFNSNLFESWGGFILYSSTPPTQPPTNPWKNSEPVSLSAFCKAHLQHQLRFHQPVKVYLDNLT